MNSSKQAMLLTIAVKVLEKELFGKTEEIQITRKKYNEEIIPRMSKMTAKLIAQAEVMVEMGISELIASFLVFHDIFPEEKDCENCPSKEECDKFNNTCKN